MLPLGLRLKCRFVVALCRSARPFLKDPGRIEAVESLRKNYGRLLEGGK
jgi:hypothetical protein